jgi:hypothetical protein
MRWRTKNVRLCLAFGRPPIGRESSPTKNLLRYVWRATAGPIYRRPVFLAVRRIETVATGIFHPLFLPRVGVLGLRQPLIAAAGADPVQVLLADPGADIQLVGIPGAPTWLCTLATLLIMVAI